MNKILNYIFFIILALAATISLWFFLNNLQPLSPGLYSFATTCIIALIILFLVFGGDVKKKAIHSLSVIVKWKYFIPIAMLTTLLVSILVRLYFYMQFSYTPVSDPITFFSAGQKIAEGSGMVGDGYVALFPYLAAYNGLLGFSMIFIDDPWLATIILNTMVDIGAATAAYFVVKMIAKPGSKLPVLAFAAWILSPFNILFSLMSLPIIVVNFFIVVSILLICLFLHHVQKNKLFSSIFIAGLIGVTISLGNSFRPVFLIMLVALLLIFTYLLITSRQRLRLSFILTPTYLLIVVIFLAWQQVSLSLIANATKLEPASNSSGWSIFVGANWHSEGKWNRNDEIQMSSLCANTKNREQCHDILREAGVQRYKEYGLVDTINLLIRKLYIFSSNQTNVYNPNISIDNYADSTTQKLFNIYLSLFIAALYLLSFWLYLKIIKNVVQNKRVPVVILFIALVFVGFFMSAMLVETSERYAQIMYPLFIIIATLGVGSWKKVQLKNS